MPAYNTPPYSKGLYPQANAIAVGYPALPGVSGLTSDQNEAIAAGYKSIPVCVAGTMGIHGYTSRQITWQVNYGVAPAAISLVLQGSINDVEAEYQTVDTSTSTSGEQGRTIATNLRFFRIYVASVTGTPTAVVKIACM